MNSTRNSGLDQSIGKRNQQDYCFLPLPEGCSREPMQNEESHFMDQGKNDLCMMDLDRVLDAYEVSTNGLYTNENLLHDSLIDSNGTSFADSSAADHIRQMYNRDLRERNDGLTFLDDFSPCPNDPLGHSPRDDVYSPIPRNLSPHLYYNNEPELCVEALPPVANEPYLTRVNRNRSIESSLNDTMISPRHCSPLPPNTMYPDYIGDESRFSPYPSHPLDYSSFQRNYSTTSFDRMHSSRRVMPSLRNSDYNQQFGDLYEPPLDYHPLPRNRSFFDSYEYNDFDEPAPINRAKSLLSFPIDEEDELPCNRHMSHSYVMESLPDFKQFKNEENELFSSVAADEASTACFEPNASIMNSIPPSNHSMLRISPCSPDDDDMHECVTNPFEVKKDNDGDDVTDGNDGNTKELTVETPSVPSLTISNVLIPNVKTKEDQGIKGIESSSSSSKEPKTVKVSKSLPAVNSDKNDTSDKTDKTDKSDEIPVVTAKTTKTTKTTKTVKSSKSPKSSTLTTKPSKPSKSDKSGVASLKSPKSPNNHNHHNHHNKTMPSNENEKYRFPCRDFEKGICLRGNACKFYHDPAKAIRSPDKIPICHDYLKGKCTRDNCRFRHPGTHKDNVLIGKEKPSTPDELQNILKHYSSTVKPRVV